MSERQHREDLRAHMAATLHAGSLVKVGGKLVCLTSPEATVRETNRLLAALDHTAEPCPLCKHNEAMGVKPCSCRSSGVGELVKAARAVIMEWQPRINCIEEGVLMSALLSAVIGVESERNFNGEGTDK